MGVHFLNKIAVVQMWPELKAAEDEIIARIVNTCKKINIDVLLINTAGDLIDSPETKIASNDVDFVIHLHFETPKTYDAFSFVTLWNPLQFYFDWGYRKYSNNIVSHDDFLSCGSPCADDHVRRLTLDDKTHLDPYFNLFHSLSTPICTPSLGSQKLFYVGINWEKLGKGRGRHQDLLQSLDKSGDLVIYGPDLFQGVRVWEGFKSYVGPLPFDGESVIHAIDEAGITLVLSSAAHIESELMSNRLFEGLAAGSVIIVDENSFARKHFGDTLLYIKTEGVEPEDITTQVRAHLEWINTHKKDAIDMATNAQNIFKSKFDMALSIKNIYEELPQRKQQLAENFLHQKDRHSVTIIGLLKEFSPDSFNSIVDNFTIQTYEKKKLILLVDEYEYRTYKVAIDAVFQKNNQTELKLISFFKRSYKGDILSENKIGKILSETLNNLPEGELVSIISRGESLFSEHYSSLVRAFEDNEDIGIAYSNVLLTYQDATRKRYFDLIDKISPFNGNYNRPNGFSRYLFKIKHDDWIPSTLKYLGWGVMDAIYSRSNVRKRIARASCTIDIQNLPYQPDATKTFERDVALLIDSMGVDEQRDFAVECFGDQVLRGTIDSKINLDEYSVDEKRRMIARLVDSLGLPLFLTAGMRRIYRYFIKNR